MSRPGIFAANALNAKIILSIFAFRIYGSTKSKYIYPSGPELSTSVRRRLHRQSSKHGSSYTGKSHESRGWGNSHPGNRITIAAGCADILVTIGRALQEILIQTKRISRLMETMERCRKHVQLLLVLLPLHNRPNLPHHPLAPVPLQHHLNLQVLLTPQH